MTRTSATSKFKEATPPTASHLHNRELGRSTSRLSQGDVLEGVGLEIGTPSHQPGNLAFSGFHTLEGWVEEVAVAVVLEADKNEKKGFLPTKETNVGNVSSDIKVYHARRKIHTFMMKTCWKFDLGKLQQAHSHGKFYVRNPVIPN